MDHLTSAVKLGIGTTKSVSNVRKDGDSTPKESVLLKTITVESLMIRVHVLNVSKVLLWKMEDVLSILLI